MLVLTCLRNCDSLLKLDSSKKNYSVWKLQMKMLLILEVLYSIVNGWEAAPSSDASSAFIQKYNQRRNKALAKIVLEIDPNILYLVGDPWDPAVVWRLLQDTYMKNTWANKLALKRELYNRKMNNNDSMQSHLKTFTEIFEYLAIVTSQMENNDKIITRARTFKHLK